MLLACRAWARERAAARWEGEVPELAPQKTQMTGWGGVDVVEEAEVEGFGVGVEEEAVAEDDAGVAAAMVGVSLEAEWL